MSTWNLGIDDVSEETRAFKDKISSKDSQIAAQQDRIVKQAADLEELKERLNDALHKLTAETQRALRLDEELHQRSEDLREEKIASENAKAALLGAHEKTKSGNLELRQLESTLERISNTSDGHKARAEKFERDKLMLDTRVKELEAHLREATQSNTTATPGRRTVARPRSSSLSNFRITSLEQDLLEVRGILAKKETDLQAANQKLAQVQQDLIKSDNERAAIGKRWNEEVGALKLSMEEKDEELMYLREQQGDGGREEELLKRIEEDDAKIAALELMLREEEGTRELKEKLRKAETQLREEGRQRNEAMQQCQALSREKDDVQHELELTRQQLEQMKIREHVLKEKATKSLETCDDPLMNDDSCLIDMDTLEPASSFVPVQKVPPSTLPDTDVDTITQIEKLLGAIERLRGERDGLRRDVQFLETESRFAIEALEARLSASVSTVTNTQTLATIDELRAEMDDLHAQLQASNEKGAAAIVERDQEIKRLAVHVQVLAISLERASFNVPVSEPASPNGKPITQRNSPHVNVEAELRVIREAEQDAREHLEEAMHEIAELNNHIDAIESERDSLALQVTNLSSDLQLAQDELTNAESRYTNLQFHQLNTMTSNEATRTLRDYIDELEGRVLRRNELVGILQHDVRRLDTNLKLQEERLMEMTSELEMLGAQKDAMVEDCADAREARDEALHHIEKLEDDLETVEGKKNALEDQRNVLEEQKNILEEQKNVLEEKKSALEEQRNALEEEKHVLEEQKNGLEEQGAQNDVIIDNLISVIHDSVNHSLDTIRSVRDQTRNSTNVESSMGQEQFQHLRIKVSELVDTLQHSEQRHNQMQNLEVMLNQREEEIQDLLIAIQSLRQGEVSVQEVQGQKECSHETIIDTLRAKNKELEDRIHQTILANSNGDDIEQSLVVLKLQHAEAVGELQKRLVEADSAVEELRTRYASVQGDRERAQGDSSKKIEELQQGLDNANKELSELHDLRDKFDDANKVHDSRLAELTEQLAAAVKDQKDAIDARDSLQAKNAEQLTEIRLLQEELDTLLGSQGAKLAAQQDLERKVLSFQGRFEEESRLLEISRAEAARLDLRLQEEIQGRSEDLRDHEYALVEATEKHSEAHENLARLEEKLQVMEKELEESRANLASLDEEKTLLHQEITTLEAENQKSKSLSRYLETQIKDSDNHILTLKADVEQLQSDIARSEKACKAAEVKLSLQNAQHKRETSEFQRELSALRSRPNLEHALAELEERNNEMEELLRAKCTEIEENDDRVLEMLKEKKKLTTKVESLNRKVQNLQAKLAAAKASSTAPPLPDQQSPVPPQPFSTMTAQASASTSAPPSRQRSATVTHTPPTTRPSIELASESARKTMNRVVSVPSSLPRPKTPERSKFIPPVFKARTPDQRMALEPDPMPTTIVIGKKRSAPDDFESCENIPVQAFTAEGEDVENRTPRVRRVLNSLQSGFTPIRHQLNRPTVPMPSPRRSAVPLKSSPNLISDLTNSPHIPSVPTSSAKPSNKRSWLGKIRGSSQDKPRSLFGGEAS